MRAFTNSFFGCVLLAFGPCTVAADATPSGKRFYEQTVAPELVVNGCHICHAANYLEPRFAYEPYRKFLAMGRAPNDNYLLNKISGTYASGQPKHPGGQRCESPDVEPCATIQQWWTAEFDGVAGEISNAQ